MKLSQSFTLAEMTRSRAAQSAGLANDPGPVETESLRALCAAVLEPLRQSIGQAIQVNSGYRSAKLNEHVGGARDSQHVKGEAADIESRGIPALDLFQRVIRLALPFDQLIYEDKSATVKWVHVSHAAGDNRGQILKAKFAPGRPTTYLELTAEAALAMTVPQMRARGAVRMSQPIEIGDEPGAVGREPRKTPKRAAPGRGKAARKGKEAIPKSAKRPKAKRPGEKRRTAKAASRKAGGGR
jgi:hypothetical protein